jgi:hypothetical protein
MIPFAAAPAASIANDLFLLLCAVAAAVGLVLVVRWRRRNYAEHLHQTSDAEVCEHLRPALELLLSRGHRVARVGQRNPDLPLEIHMQPPFSPNEVYAELKLAEPVFVSERNVLYCKEDWCEIHPKP